MGFIIAGILILLGILHVVYPNKYTIIAWYDFWIGIYYDKNKRIIYILPVPCLGFKISLSHPQLLYQIVKVYNQKEVSLTMIYAKIYQELGTIKRKTGKDYTVDIIHVNKEMEKGILTVYVTYKKLGK